MRNTSLLIAAVVLTLTAACGKETTPMVDLDDAKELALRDARSEFAESQLRRIRVSPGPVIGSGETTVTNDGNLTILGLELDVTVRGPGGADLSAAPYRWEYHPTTGLTPGDESVVLLSRRSADIPGAAEAPAGSTYAVQLRKAWVYDSGESVVLDPLSQEEKARLDLLLEGLSVTQRAELDAQVEVELDKLEPLMERAQHAASPRIARSSRRDTDREQAALRRREAQRSEAARLRAEERSRRREADQVQVSSRRTPPREAAKVDVPDPKQARPQPRSEPKPEDVAFLGWWKTCRGEIGNVVKAASELSRAARRGSFATAGGESRKFITAVNKAVGTHDAHPPGPMDYAVDTLLTSLIDAAKALQAKRYIAYESRMDTALDQLKQIDSAIREILRQP